MSKNQGTDRSLLLFFVDPIARRWRLVLSVTVLAAMVSVLFAMAFPPPYVAEARVAMVTTREDLQLDPKYKTISSDDMAASGSAAALNQDARNAALVSLIDNGLIADQVVKQMGNELPPNLRSSDALLRKVNGGTVSRSDLIGITASSTNPQLAADIANDWAHVYEQYVNDLYATAPGSMPANVNNELAAAKNDYDAKEQAVEQLTATSRVGELTRLITEKTDTIQALQASETFATSEVVTESLKSRMSIITATLGADTGSRLEAIEADRKARQQAFDSTTDAELNGKLAVFEQQAEEKTNQLADLYATKQRTQDLLADAHTMQQQVSQGGDPAAASNALALLLLKTGAFAASGGTPSNMQVQTAASPSATAKEQLADLDSLVATLEARLGDLQGQIKTLSTAMDSGTAYNFLGDISASTTGVAASAPVTSTADDPPNPLAAAIQKRYQELFDVGWLAKDAQNPVANSQLLADTERLYPDLFSVGNLEQLTEGTNPLSDTIAKLEADVRSLQAQLQQQTADMQRATQARDLAWNS